MRVAVVGSRSLEQVDLEAYLPVQTTEIVSGGARGIDQCAKTYALAHHLKYTEFLPDYASYGRAAPLKRNDEIIGYAEQVLIFWDGHSRGTDYVMKRCQKEGIPHRVFSCDE